MKKQTLKVLGFVILLLALLSPGCKKSDDGPTWSNEDKASYEEALSVQDQAGDLLAESFQSMDSLDAIDKVQQFFTSSPAVSQSTINNNGIAVQYANGMRGGLFLSGKKLDYKQSTTEIPADERSDGDFKSIVNKRKMLQMDAAYSEFSYYTDQVHNKHVSNLSKVGIGVSEYLKDDEVTLDRLTQLSGYGMIDMCSHGIAWPKETNITDVYYLSGETISENTSKKYWDDLKTGNIPVMKIWYLNRVGKYFVSPDFITKHNDFSQDTVFFYGGFCYSFLGGWPDIIDDFGDGAYLGFTWKVQGFHCANWDVNSVSMMSDTTKEEPFTIEEWMNDPGVEKSYWDEEDHKTVKIHYAGDGNLTLWSDVKVSIIALSSDGAPVSEPGEKNTAYPFRCNAITNITSLEYKWDIGDGSTPTTTESNEVEISWEEDGEYELTVEVIDKSNGNSIGKATAQVSIGQDVLDFILTCNTIQFYCGPQEAIQFSPPHDLSGYVGGNTDMVWDGFNFSASDESETGSVSIDGTLSSDGKRVSLVAVYTTTILSEQSQYTWTVTDYPFSYYEPNGIEHAWDRPGVVYQTTQPNIQDHLTLSGYSTLWGETYTVTGINWAAFDELRITLFWWDK